MKKTRQLVTIGLLATGLVALYGCSSDAVQGEEDSGNIQSVELKIRTSVEMARAGSNGTEGVVTGEAFADGDTIAVYAHSGHYNTTSNNYALYKLNSSSWGAIGTTDKIYLSTEAATIYGVYPPKLEVTHSSAIDANTTAKITGLFTGKADSADDGNKITLPSTSNAANSSTETIHTAKGEKDCMWATAPGSSSGTTIDATSPTATLTMKHALALVSFKFYKEASFQGTGKLTKIKLTKVDTNGEFKTGAATMNISSGTITITDNDTQGTLTRFPYTDTSTEGYTLKALSELTGNNESEKKATLPAFGILVYPKTGLEADKVKAVFTIDDVDYPINIPAASSSDGSHEWEAGYNTTYTVLMKGKELGITSVTVTDWQTATVSSELVPIDGTTTTGNN